MIKADLRGFVDRVTDQGYFGPDDLRHLQGDILADGIASRGEVEALLALGRNLDGDLLWREAVTAPIVDFVVRGAHPTGTVNAETSRWLASALDAADLPDMALHIAYAVVEAADAVDEALLIFILRGRQRVPQGLAA
jgi:hypothetical protein